MTLKVKCLSPAHDRPVHDECLSCAKHHEPLSWWGITYQRNSWKFDDFGYCDAFKRVDDQPETLTPMGFSEEATRELR